MTQKNKFFFIYLLIITIFASSCLKEKSLRELKYQEIAQFIENTGLYFDTLPSGIFLHKTFRGIGANYKKGNIVTIEFTSAYMDGSGLKTVTFARNDTFSFRVGDREILKGWSELATYFAPGGVGIAVFPYKNAYADNQTPLIPINSNIVYYFRFLSNDYKTDQTSLFWQYSGQYDTAIYRYSDTLAYLKYFEGERFQQNPDGVPLDIKLYTIADSLVFASDSLFLNYNDFSYTKGLCQGTKYMNEGEMGQIFIPPNLSYQDGNLFNIKPYTAMYAVVRVISADKNIEQNSLINKYLYLNKLTPDSISAEGIYRIITKKGDGQTPTDGSRLLLSDSLYVIGSSTPFSSCQDCIKTLNSSSFLPGQIIALKMLKEGENAIFIIPYQQAYGSSGSADVPPYMPVVYKVKLTSVL